jgi:hypothetical protein
MSLLLPRTGLYWVPAGSPSASTSTTSKDGGKELSTVGTTVLQSVTSTMERRGGLGAQSRLPCRGAEIPRAWAETDLILSYARVADALRLPSSKAPYPAATACIALERWAERCRGLTPRRPGPRNPSPRWRGRSISSGFWTLRERHLRPTLARGEIVAPLEREPDLGLPVTGTQIASRDTTAVCACLQRFFFPAIFFGGAAYFGEVLCLKESEDGEEC